METTGSGQKEKRKSERWQPSILVYLIMMNFIILCLLFPTMALYFFRHETAFQNLHLERMIVQMRQDLQSRSSSLAQSLALSSGQAIAGFDFSFLNTLMGQVVIDNDEAIYTYIMDPNRRILAHNDAKEIGHTLEDTTSIIIAGTENKIYLARLTDETQPRSVQFFDMKMQQGNDSINIMEVVTPVYSGATLAGFLRCGFSLKDLDYEVTALRQEWADKMNSFKFSFVSITLFFFLVGLVVSFLFTRNFIRSMLVLRDGVEKISKGDLKHRILMDGLTCQEFTLLSDSFNSMTGKLRASYEQLEQHSKDLEHKVEERTDDLKMAQAKLLQQAHEAGMAEMAVGILHNIGNAITPAKVSTALLIKRINESRIRNHIKDMMARFGDILSKPNSSSQEETEKLKQIVEVLPDAVIEEFDHINSEVKRIRDKHEHIESIIHLQLRYARLSGNVENVNVNKVVLDSLEMLDESITKYSVTLIKDLDPNLPPIKSEKSKLLQVVVNLVKNGVEAMRDADSVERTLAISTHTDSSGENIAISIKDTGMGFAPEDKKKLFTYGYTTKKTGSGFGLHSCANFLIANKGSIEAISDGPGTGAEFIVHLSLSRDDENFENAHNNRDKL